MQSTWLRTFLVAAEHEHFMKAADVLFISQPTVTSHIRHLEKALGCALFHKHGRGVRLTEEGRLFLPRAEGMLHQLEEGYKELKDYRQGYRQSLLVAVSPIVAETKLPFWLRAFQPQHPEIRVDVQVKESDEIGQLVAQGKADVGLSRMKTQAPTLINTFLYEEAIRCIAPHDGGDAETSIPLGLHDFVQTMPVLSGNHPEYWPQLLDKLRQKYPGLRVMEVSQIHITRRFVEEGLGFSFLPESAVRRELVEGRVLNIPVDGLGLQNTETFAVHRSLDERAERFVRCIQRIK
ncbi:LysR family transcriptional regulator [Bacillaceae bacterium SIJ1]|uniref:LysR family transcriptional regulator n=1 Tax=Litoribacterium kuwaitense TaxID=1398745 RepID=UPI0013EB0B6E|nr:LysR family transcriptional regulator [Litoribacterium kuwaitense]NGP45884.1 LysR family transcriptional regulator [Litoribacterium kuwaitense]